MIVVVAALFAGCASGRAPVASPPVLVNTQACQAAEAAGRLSQAESFCQQALMDAGPEPANPQFRSGRLYNLARIKRKLGKPAQAEVLYKQSLTVEQDVSGPDSTWTGRRLIELAICLAQQDKWLEGAGYLERALPMAARFAEPDRSTSGRVIGEYSRQLRSRNQLAQADRLEQQYALLVRSPPLR